MIFSAIGVTGLLSVLLVAAFLFLGFRVLESNWSYRISKPFAWDEAVRQRTVSADLKRTERSYRDKGRFYMFWLQVERLKQGNIEGSFAEVGVYKGETARMLYLMDPSRRIHLFDTFEGFSSKDLNMETIHSDNATIDFSDTTVGDVHRFIGGGDNFIFHPGYFPDTANVDERFALVHLDADLYAPTLAGLRFFYSKMTKGGVIIVHDYNHNWSGVKKAVDEFMITIPEGFVSVADWQGSVVIVKS